jgi:hypothetical protein
MRRYADHDWRADPVNLLIISPTVIKGIWRSGFCLYNDTTPL